MKRPLLSSKTKTVLKTVLLCSTVLMMASSLLRSGQLDKLYGLPQEELVQHLDQYAVTSSEVITEEDITSRLWWLSGATPLGSFSLPQDRVCSISVERSLGEVKLLLVPPSGASILWEAGDPTDLPLPAGSYQVYGIGKHFFGKVALRYA